jgi:hypothetical protein
MGSSLFVSGVGVEISPLLLRQFNGLLYQPCVRDGDDCGAISGMNEWQGKPAAVLFSLSQNPHDLNRARTRAAALGSRRITT